MIKVGIIGATGYTARELIKILTRHPSVQIASVTSRNPDGQSIAEVHPQLTGTANLPLTSFSLDAFAGEVDFAFSCLPHAASAAVVKQLVENDIKVVDFSADYRLDDWQTFEQWYQTEHPDRERVGSIPYGIPELFRDDIRKANLVANPGCFPSSALIPLAPLFAKGLLGTQQVIVDSKTGISGGGRNPKPHLHYPESNESMSAYAVGTHRHQPEIEQLLKRFSDKPANVVFTPHLAPMDRGILSTCYLTPTEGQGSQTAAIHDHLKSFYADEPFIHVTESLPQTKDVSHTNRCHIAVRENGSTTIIVSVLDNLVKGASGAAVQNFNLMNGLDETTALH